MFMHMRPHNFNAFYISNTASNKQNKKLAAARNPPSTNKRAKENAAAAYRDRGQIFCYGRVWLLVRTVKFFTGSLQKNLLYILYISYCQT